MRSDTVTPAESSVNIIDLAKAAAKDGLQPNVERALHFAGVGEKETVELSAFGARKAIHVTYPRRYAEAYERLTHAEIGSTGLADCQGIYFVPNRVHPGVAGRYPQPSSGEGVSISEVWPVSEQRANDGNVERRRVVLIDCDAVRPSGISATREEKQASLSIAKRIFDDLAPIVGNASIAFADSGNGYQVLIAVDIEPSKEAAETAKQLLESLDKIYSTDAAKVDRTTFNHARLIPMYGTMKRKGASSAERPHRRTWIASPSEVTRLDADAFAALVAGVAERVPVAKRTKPKAMPAAKATSTRAPSPKWDTFWSEVRAVAIADVLAWLGLVDDEKPICPGCGETKGVVDLTSKGTPILKCSHDRCKDRGFAKNGSKASGCYGPIEIVMTARGIDEKFEAAKVIAEQFKIEVPRARDWVEDVDLEDFGLDGEDVEVDEAADEAQEATAKEKWTSKLLRHRGRVRGVAANVEIALTYWPAMAGKLAWDEFRQQVVWAGAAPWVARYPETAHVTRGVGWTHEDTTRLVSVLNGVGIDVGRETIREVVRLIAVRQSYHPVREYLDGLKWDGVRRLDTWLTTYLGVEGSPYASRVGRWWAVQAVRRIRRPGAPAKYILTLEGNQDVGKSTALKMLCGVSWYSESRLDVGSLSGQLGLKSTWIWELAEGAIINKSDRAELKQYIGQTHDHYIPKWSNDPVDVPRQAVFAMTINPEQDGYLTDTTGNVRYWPVRVTKVDFAGIEQDRDQLWAEADAMLQAGEVPEPRTDEEKRLLGEVVADRVQIDPWHDRIEEHVRNMAELTVEEILRDVMEIKLMAQEQKDKNRVVRVLRQLGYTQAPGRPVRDGKRVRLYVLPSEPVAGTSLPSDEADARDVLHRAGWAELVLPDGRRVLTQPKGDVGMAEVIDLLAHV